MRKPTPVHSLVGDKSEPDKSGKSYHLVGKVKLTIFCVSKSKLWGNIAGRTVTVILGYTHCDSDHQLHHSCNHHSGSCSPVPNKTWWCKVSRMFGEGKIVTMGLPLGFLFRSWSTFNQPGRTCREYHQAKGAILQGTGQSWLPGRIQANTPSHFWSCVQPDLLPAEDQTGPTYPEIWMGRASAYRH